ncbi:hypothetical protein CARUB_v10003454mg [Capsella rubella]|uniref:Ubiquitin-like domain-containing protein n=1 Tax=Capsella rubella TaxID=81985 RepID=R0FJW4_9BRAS|nr:biquitin domain-containing protein 7SL RNA1 [Capsella rubella]EOA22742.1 hypothetical protein CARUB_v10003454mg [Capsella rubella]
MKYLVEVLSGSSFEIEVNHTDTLLEVKEKIEKSQGIPVSKQTLIVDGIVILRKDLNVEQCKIVYDSCLQLDLSYDNDDQMQMPQTEQTLAPWIPVEEYFERQDWPLTADEMRKIYNYQTETNQAISKVQDSPVMVRGNKRASTSVKVESNNNNNDHVAPYPHWKQMRG